MMMMAYTLKFLNHMPHDFGSGVDLRSLSKEFMAVWMSKLSCYTHVTHSFESILHESFNFILMDQLGTLWLFKVEMESVSPPILQAEQSIT
jgi:hypothetical protein